MAASRSGIAVLHSCGCDVRAVSGLLHARRKAAHLESFHRIISRRAPESASSAALDEVSSMLRSFVAGNALIAILLMLLSWGFFTVMHLKYPFLLGSVSGVLNLVPYLGARAGLDSAIFDRAGAMEHLGPYLVVAAVLTVSPYRGSERPDARDCRAPRSPECPGGHRCIAILGMAVGRNRIDPGDSDHGDSQGDLRSFRGLGASGPLARGIEQGIVADTQVAALI